MTLHTKDQNDDRKQTQKGSSSIDPIPLENSSFASSSSSGLARAWLYGALVSQMTVSVIGGGLSGYFLDQWIGTEPILLIIMLLSGCVSGLILLLRGLKQLEQTNHK